jgi:phenylalanyl-tRNA synthetase beta subunit
MERTLTQEEVNVIHKQIEKAAALKLNVSIR